MRAALVIARTQLRILRRDPWFLLIMFGMPLVVMPIFADTIGSALRSAGVDGATGAEIVVPGQTVLFGFFVGGSAAFSVFREHGWKTWDRLRASAAGPAALLAGYAVPWILVLVVYSTTLLLAGAAFVGLRLNGGSPIAVLIMLVAYSTFVVSMVLLATSTLRTVNQVNGLVNVGAMVLGGLGGALVPLETLPGWARAIAPATPTYWAMDGHRAVFLEGGGVSDVLAPAVILFGGAAVVMAVAVSRFRVDETKEFYA